MLDGVHLALETLAGEALLQQAVRAGPLAAGAQAIQDKADIGAGLEQVCGPLPHIGAGVLIEGHMVDVGERHTCFRQTPLNGLAGETRPVLDPPEALLLGGGYEHTIADDTGAGISVEGVQS